ncbi:conserved hypothetical protein, partial [Ricinus communis]
MHRDRDPAAFHHQVIAADAQVRPRGDVLARRLQHELDLGRRMRREGDAGRGAAFEAERRGGAVRHHLPFAGSHVPGRHLGRLRRAAGIVGDHLEVRGRCAGHQDRGLERAFRVVEAPAHRIARPGLVAAQRNSAQPLALEDLVGLVDPVGPPMALGIHVLALRLVRDRRGVERFQISRVAARVPGGPLLEGPALPGLAGERLRPVRAGAKQLDHILVDVLYRGGAALAHPGEDRGQIFPVA